MLPRKTRFQEFEVFVDIPQPRFAPGEAVHTGFFDKYSRFLQTSDTYAARGRLNLRYEAMIAQNREVLRGARVLDIASHDGRWSFAALEAGAVHVTGIEAREELTTNACENFAHYGVDPDRYRFITGDTFEVLQDESFDVDVVMCFGFMYHTLRYNELMKYITTTKARYLILDTIVDTGPRAVIRVWTEQTDRERNGFRDRYAHGDQVVSGRPTPLALRRILSAYGFEIDQVSNWAALQRDNPGIRIGGYWKRKRITLRSRSSAANG